MHHEGRGTTAPTPARVSIARPVFRDLQALAAEREAARGYAARSSPWGRGLIGNPTLVGLMGEQACCLYLSARLRRGVDVDRRDRPRGDGGRDVEVFGVRVQVKCRRRRGDVLVRRQTREGRILALPWDVLVVSTWEAPAGEAGDQVVTLDGWTTRGRLLGLGAFGPARRGDHMNIAVRDSDLEPMARLVAMLRNRHHERGQD